MFESVIRGRVWKFDDNISTDYIMPGFTRGETPKERASFCMRAIRPRFAQEISPGDVIVAGRNFGCGSSRPAAQNFVALGLGGVFAESFARTFFRSTVNVGFPLLYVNGVHGAFEEGEALEADLESGEVRNLTTGALLKAPVLPEVAMRILRAGGIINLLKQEYGRQ